MKSLSWSFNFNLYSTAPESVELSSWLDFKSLPYTHTQQTLLDRWRRSWVRLDRQHRAMTTNSTIRVNWLTEFPRKLALKILILTTAKKQRNKVASQNRKSYSFMSSSTMLNAGGWPTSPSIQNFTVLSGWAVMLVRANAIINFHPLKSDTLLHLCALLFLHFFIFFPPQLFVRIIITVQTSSCYRPVCLLLASRQPLFKLLPILPFFANLLPLVIALFSLRLSLTWHKIIIWLLAPSLTQSSFPRRRRRRPTRTLSRSLRWTTAVRSKFYDFLIFPIVESIKHED